MLQSDAPVHRSQRRARDDVGLFDRVLRVDVIAEREPAALSRVVPTDRFPLHPLRCGKRVRNSRICAASVGDATVSERMRMPAPCPACCAESTARTASTKAPNDRISPRSVIVCDRSGSYRPRMAAARTGRSCPGSRGVPGCLRSWSDGLRGSRRGAHARAIERHRRRVEQRLSGHQLFGLTDVRNELLGGWRVHALTRLAPATLPSTSGSRGARPDRAIQRRSGETRGGGIP